MIPGARERSRESKGERGFHVGAQGQLLWGGDLEGGGQKVMREERCENLGQVILVRENKFKGPKACIGWYHRAE